MADSTPAALMHLKPRPYKLPYDIPAGLPSPKGVDKYRSNVIVPMGDLLAYSAADRWNAPGTNYYSGVPQPIIGEPYDTSKPRKGRWGETLGTKLSEDSFLFEDEWEQMKLGRLLREEIAMDAARKDLQKRVEICLYGAPREKPLKSTCPLPMPEL